MKFVQKEFTATLEEKKSKFLAFLVPYKDFDKTMQRLRSEHPKAVHFVYAYRYLNEFEQIVENSSDDGEPRGTSGKPTLAVLSGAGIINSAAIIVRYFGGIKLGTGGIIAIPQKRLNGKDRTIGFIQALEEDNIKVSGMYQQVDFSYEETYNYSKKLIDENKNLRAIWLQGSDKYKGALDAIKKANKQNEIALICFDAEPEFLEMIQNGDLVASAMQQPYIIGQEAVVTLNNYFNNKKVKKEQKMEILSISKENIDDKLKIIKLNVLGIKSDEK